MSFVDRLVVVLVLVAQGASADNAEQLRGLLTGSRTILSLGLTRSSLFLLLADSTRESNPDRIYTFNTPRSALNLNLGQPRVPLLNGGTLSAKHPKLFGALKGKTIGNTSVVITDSHSSYLLVALDAHSSLLYNLEQNRLVPFAGSSELEQVMSEYPTQMLLSSSESMHFYSHAQYTVGNTKCAFAFQSHQFNGSSLAVEHITLNPPYEAESLCKDTPVSANVSANCDQGNCVNWPVMAGFADQQRIYLIGRGEVHVLENMLEGNGQTKKKVSVVTVSLVEFFAGAQRKATGSPKSVGFIIVTVLLLLIFLFGLCIYFCCGQECCLFFTECCMSCSQEAKPSARSTRRKVNPPAGRSSSRRRSRSRSRSRSQSRTRRSKKQKRSSKRRKGSSSKRRAPTQSKPRVSKTFRDIRAKYAKDQTSKAYCTRNRVTIYLDP